MKFECRLILANASPRRRDILAALGIPFEVKPADIDETLHREEMPEKYVARMAEEKAIRVSLDEPECWVLGADTVVSLSDATGGNEIFGKPTSIEDHRRMLQTLSGQTHQVRTAVALAQRGKCVDQITVTTHVTFSTLGFTRIESYILDPEGRDKAGGYALQGLPQTWVTALHGSPTNVIGLPAVETEMLFTKHAR